MTREEGIILSAYTGYLLVDSFDPVHEFVEKLLGRPLWTHEFADKALLKEIQGKCRPLLPVAKEEPRWIPVSERLPKEEDADITGCVLAIERSDGFARRWQVSSVQKYPLLYTHWMPILELPKEV